MYKGPAKSIPVLVNGGSSGIELFTTSLPVIPREGRSTPGQKVQASLLVNHRISSTRYSTYCFHGFSLVIQHKVALESVQKNVTSRFLVGVNLAQC